MSSILEALRELEASKSPAAPPTGAWTEEQRRSRTWLETIGIIAGGLAIGAAAFAFILWLSGVGLRGTAPSPGTAVPGSDAAPPAAPAPSAPGSDVAPPAAPAPPAPGSDVAPPAAPPPPASEPAAGSTAPPGWLSSAEPPRARVAPGGSPPDRALAASRAPQEPPRSSGAAAPVQDDSVLVVSSISYSPDGARRSVTMRVGGTLATLREGQSVHGAEVQLILPGAVYVRRGPEIFVLEPER